MQRKRKIGLIAALIAVLAVSAVAAQSFFFTFIETPYFPSDYNWIQPWTVKQVVDFAEATLAVTGSGYQYDSHDYVLTLKNIAPEGNYVITNMDYSATWVVGIDSEDIVTGTYSGALLIGETVEYTGTFTPTIFGAGEVHMDLTNIVWAISEPITWITEIVDETGLMGGNFEITAFTVTGASMSNTEPGTVSITIQNHHYPAERGISFNVEIVELAQIVGAEVDGRLPEEYTDFTYNFAALENGGAYTMRITITDWI